MSALLRSVLLFVDGNPSTRAPVNMAETGNAISIFNPLS